MARILKATIGIRFSERMFRLSTHAGALIDNLLALRGKPLDSGDFETIGRDAHDMNIKVYSETAGKYLHIDLENVTYTVDLYDKGENFSFDTFLDNFSAIWNVINETLHCREIRRVGLVTERRFLKGNEPNRFLLDHLTTFKFDGFPAKFNLSFEVRKNTGPGGLPDPTKDDFINYLYFFYDSILDIEHSEPGAININLDVQRYFSPSLRDGPIAALRKLKAEYDKADQDLLARIKPFGLADGKPA
ncbi:MAG: hypothetical protein HZC22_15015 [Rhodocyclales bacterium]|nr:hypothetical protein [Rhodocyclales bacterium]